MNTILGTCGDCSHAVVQKLGWFGRIPAKPEKPKCYKCGAVPIEPFGQIIDMFDRKNAYAKKVEVKIQVGFSAS